MDSNSQPFKIDGAYHWFKTDNFGTAHYVFGELKKRGFFPCSETFQNDTDNKIIRFVLDNPGTTVVIICKDYGVRQITSKPQYLGDPETGGYQSIFTGNREHCTIFPDDLIVVEKPPNA